MATHSDDEFYDAKDTLPNISNEPAKAEPPSAPVYSLDDFLDEDDPLQDPKGDEPWMVYHG